MISTELSVTPAIGIVDDSDGRRLARVQTEYVCLLKRTKVLWQTIRLIGQGRMGAEGEIRTPADCCSEIASQYQVQQRAHGIFGETEEASLDCFCRCAG